MPSRTSSLAPAQLADRWTEQILGPAVRALSPDGPRFTRRKASRAEGVLEGNPRLAADNFTDIFDRMRAERPTLEAFIAAGREYALEHAGAAGGTPENLRADFEALSGGPPVQPDSGAGYGWSDRVLASVMRAHNLQDSAALIARAVALDDGNKYLNRSELERAAETLGHVDVGLEPGIVSDLDQTIVPPVREGLPPAAYPGIAALLGELELGAEGRGRPGDTYYVTARSPERVELIPAWLAEHHLPEGPISTGVSQLPWVAEREKVADITAILEAHPDQKFILFGDSAHRDPEVYRQVIQRFPDRISAAFIHRVNNVNPARLEGLTGIANYAECAALLFQQRLLDEPAARRVMTAAMNEGLAINAADIDALIRAHQPG